MDKVRALTIIAILLFLNSCEDDMMRKNRLTKEQVKQLLGNTTDKDLIPNYPTVYTPNIVELDNIDTLSNKNKIDQVDCLTILSNSCKELKADYNNYLLDSYKTLEYTNERLAYVDIANIARFIIWKFKSNESDCFDRIFETVEVILKKGDKDTQNLIVVGLFEGIQNIGGWHKVDYYKGFDKWLRPKSKKTWEDLINSWEGEK